MHAEDHNYAEPPHLAPLSEMKPTKEITIKPKYADDITFASTSINTIKNIKETVPEALAKFNLQVNETKTEQYTIPDPPNTEKKDSWRTCKLLGSLLDTKEDISRRKQLVIEAMKRHKKIYKSKYLSLKQKIRHFNMYIQAIMLYNCELWTMTDTLNKAIDAFHRRQLRYAINIVWPKKISNEKLYELTKVTPWSSSIEKRRMSWLGHLMRLDAETPARIALKEALIPEPRKRGRPPATWIKTVQNDLNKRNIEINLSHQNAITKLETLTEDRKNYTKTISMLPRERIFREPAIPSVPAATRKFKSS